VLLGTTNPAKLREWRRLLRDLPVPLLSLSDISSVPPSIEETGASFLENALVKARAYAAWSGLPALADDGGLQIDALGGAPGIHSRRWVDGTEASDERLIAHTLECLAGVPEWQRGASMIVVAVLAVPEEGVPLHAGVSGLARWWTALHAGWSIHGQGAIVGSISREPSPRRERGFPYRSLFVLPDGRFYVDLQEAEHTVLLHRRAAAEPIRQAIAHACAVRSD